MLSDEELNLLEAATCEIHGLACYRPERVQKVFDQAREANTLRAENVELRRDAERLYKLLQLGGSPHENFWSVMLELPESEDDDYRDDDIFQAIDAAIAKGAGT